MHLCVGFFLSYSSEFLIIKIAISSFAQFSILFNWASCNVILSFSERNAQFFASSLLIVLEVDAASGREIWVIWVDEMFRWKQIESIREIVIFTVAKKWWFYSFSLLQENWWIFFFFFCKRWFIYGARI